MGRPRKSSSISLLGDDEVPLEKDLSAMAWVTLICPTAMVYLITPSCWIMLIYHQLRYGTVHPVHSGFFYKLWLYMSWFEVPFSIWLQYISYRANDPPKFKAKDPEHMRGFLMQCLDVGLERKHSKGEVPSRRPQLTSRKFSHVNDTTEEQAAFTRRKIRQWFFNKPIKEIKRDNAREWLAWAVGGGKSLEEAEKDPHTTRVIDEGVEWVEKRLQIKFEPGYNEDAPCIRLTRDRLNVLSRPLGYYVVTNGVTFVAYAYLFSQGFKVMSSHGIQCLVKPPVPESKRTPIDPKDKYAKDFKLPIVFLHGLGIGLGQYATFIRYLASSQKGVVLVLQPNISTQIWHPKFLNAASPGDHAKAVKDITGRLGIKEATILSHSNGTMAHGWLLRGCPELCVRNVLVDPVSFRLWEADVCHHFLHQRWGTSLQVLLGYFVARELGVAHTIGRLFSWSEMILWEHEFPSVAPEDFHVIVAKNDFLLDAKSIVSYLQECGVDGSSITMCDGYQHGQALIADSFGMKTCLANL